MDYKNSQYTKHKRIQTLRPCASPTRRPDPDDRLTLRRLANGCCFAATLILLYVFLAPIF